MGDEWARLLEADGLRAERLVGLARAIAVSAAALALTVQPPTDAKFLLAALFILTLYGLGTVMTALWLLRVHHVSQRVSALAHAGDVLVACLLQSVAPAVSNPFAAYLALPMFAAAVRWRARGVGITALVAAPLVMVASAFGPSTGSTFVEASFLRLSGVASLAMAFIGLTVYDDRRRRVLARLAATPERGSLGDSPPFTVDLGDAARLLDAPRVLFLWRGRDDIGVRAALWADGVVECPPVDLGQLADVVPTAPGDAGFFSADRAPDAIIGIRRTSGGLGAAERGAIPGPVRNLLGPGAVVGVTVRGVEFEARLLAVGRHGVTAADVLLAEVVGSRLAVAIDRAFVSQGAREAARVCDRAAIARDLHDGTLQSLAALDIGLEAFRAGCGKSSAIRAHIGRLQGIVSREQTDLRAFIRDLTAPLRASRLVDLHVMLRDLGERLEREWNVRIELDVPAISVPRALAREVSLMVRETVVNARKHGGSSRVQVVIRRCRRELQVAVGDDGRGFPFVGEYDDDVPASGTFGPWSLRERVGSLGGHLTVHSRPTGARIEMTLPLVAGEHEH